MRLEGLLAAIWCVGIAAAVACASSVAQTADSTAPKPGATSEVLSSEVVSQGDAPSKMQVPGNVVPSTSPNVALPVGYKIESLLDGLDVPTSLAALPDGRLLIAEQVTGNVRVVEDGKLQDEPWLELPVFVQTHQFAQQELGLDSIAVDPEFARNHYVYIYYTEARADPSKGRTVFARLKDIDGKGTELTPLVVIDEAPKSRHVGGGIAFDGDAILLGIGDHELAGNALRLDQPVGKILRIDRDGKALPDNPFVSDRTADPRVYVYGVRNPFGLAVDPVSGAAIFTDNREAAGDAVYELAPAANYGWPREPIALREPLVIYDHSTGVAGITAYESRVLSEFTGDFFYCSFHDGGALHWLKTGVLEGFDIVQRDRIIAPGCTTSVTVGADGFLYFLDFEGGSLLRISR